jgi:DNA polymerase III epsilon subunit family exonuclease
MRIECEAEAALRARSIALVDLDISPQAAVFTVIDVETTGLQPEDRITEVAAVRMNRLREVSHFESLINPGIHIPPVATAVSGIDDDLVSGAPDFIQISSILDCLLADAVIVAHNASFDLAFLSAERKRAGLTPWKGPILDTLRLTRNLYALSSYSLGALHESLGLQQAPAHRALADVMATIALLRDLLARLGDRAPTVRALLAAQEPIPVSWDEFPKAALAPEAAAKLRGAEAAGVAVEIVYEGRNGPRHFRMIPHQLERNGPLYYLCGVSAGKPDERMVFRIDRIRGVHEIESD